MWMRSKNFIPCLRPWFQPRAGEAGIVERIVGRKQVMNVKRGEGVKDHRRGWKVHLGRVGDKVIW